MKRRDFITILAGATVGMSVARAQWVVKAHAARRPESTASQWIRFRSLGSCQVCCSV